MIIQADGVTFLDGFIDRTQHSGKAGVLEIHGRDKVGRVVDESAPAVDYSGMTILEAVRRLLSPWFDPSQVVIGNARNRLLRRGKGRRVASSTEPVVTVNVRVPRRGQVHPGETRWKMIHEILSRADLIGFSSADGKQFVIGKANQTQSPQYLFTLSAPGSNKSTNVRDMTLIEDDGDRYSLYMCGGVGGQTDTNYGRNIADNRGAAFDNPFNHIDGTGRDFLFPKRMYMPERAFDSFNDADRVAKLEQNRRDMHRHVIRVEADTFGQVMPGSSTSTFFATDTTARVLFEEENIDDIYYVMSCNHDFVRTEGEVTTMEMVPIGTEIVL